MTPEMPELVSCSKCRRNDYIMQAVDHIIRSSCTAPKCEIVKLLVKKASEVECECAKGLTETSAGIYILIYTRACKPLMSALKDSDIGDTAECLLPAGKLIAIAAECATISGTLAIDLVTSAHADDFVPGFMGRAIAKLTMSAVCTALGNGISQCVMQYFHREMSSESIMVESLVTKIDMIDKAVIKKGAKTGKPFAEVSFDTTNEYSKVLGKATEGYEIPPEIEGEIDNIRLESIQKSIIEKFGVSAEVAKRVAETTVMKVMSFARRAKSAADPGTNSKVVDIESLIQKAESLSETIAL